MAQKLSKLSTASIAFLVGLCGGCSFYPATQEAIVSQYTCMEACFTPSMSCAPRIIAAIDQAQKSIYVQAYSLTSKSIAQALINAHRRGVMVQVLLDGSQNQSRFGQSQSLLAAGIPL